MRDRSSAEQRVRRDPQLLVDLLLSPLQAKGARGNRTDALQSE
jgi:hypothetical protein